MTGDQMLVLGIVLAVFSVPAILSAMSDSRSPRVAPVILVAGLALVVWAFVKKPGGYALTDIPEAFIRVLAEMVR